MNTMIQIVTAIALILSIIVPFGYFFLGEKSQKRYKKSLQPTAFSSSEPCLWLPL